MKDRSICKRRGVFEMRTLASLVAVGVGAFAYMNSMDRKTKRRWRKRMAINSFKLEDLMPRKRTMKRMRNQMSKAF